MNTTEEIMALAEAFFDAGVFEANENEAGSSKAEWKKAAVAVEQAREALRTRLAALVADAERYQWLRNSNQQPQREVFLDCKTKPELDAAIDAARATQQTKESQ